MAAAGRTFTGGNVAGDIRDAAVGAAVLAHENVEIGLRTPPDGTPAVPVRALPTETYYGDGMRISHFFNGEGIEILHRPAAHTDGDSIVRFRGSDVIAAGDLFVTETYPVIDLERGGNIQGVVESLNRILDLAFPEFRTEGGTMIVPGHGRIADSADVAYYRDMVTIIRDRVQDMIKKGMTLEQVKSAKPTADYDPRYGATTGPWTTDMFVEAVYRSLAPGAPSTGALYRPWLTRTRQPLRSNRLCACAGLMRIALGVVEGEAVRDVTAALDVLPAYRYPLPTHDVLIANLDKVVPRIKAMLPGAPSVPLASVKLLSPVANPGKLVAAPVNYQKHLDEVKVDSAIHANNPAHTITIQSAGLFLKATSSLIGPGGGIAVCHAGSADRS